jgi:glycosyltransferase involved in cell wall biosynthesis
MKPWGARLVCHAWVRFSLGIAWLLAGRRPRPLAGTEPRRLTIALLGPFISANWLQAYTGPMAASSAAPRLVAITRHPLTMPDTVELVVVPSRWTGRLGSGVARALWLMGWAWRHRPDVVIGFHLPWNGMVALLVARMVRARAAYFCVAGIHEVLDGGVHSEHRVFEAMGAPSPALQRLLVRVINQFDDVFTMGTRSRAALIDAGVDRPIRAMGVAIDSARFHAAEQPGAKDVELITVARLVPVKRLELLLETVALLARWAQARGEPPVRLAVVGEGPERPALQALAWRLGIAHLVQFCGFTDDVVAQLRRARVFVLTSKSEGLPISLLEAMSCRIPGVAPLTGDLEDVLHSGCNGQVVHGARAEDYARAIDHLLHLPREDFLACSQAAVEAAAAHWVPQKAAQWSQVFKEWSV